jgi:hypothetical protein
MPPSPLQAGLVYAAALALLLTAALGRRENADSPPPPPPLTNGEGAALAQATPIDPLLLVKARAHAGPAPGAAVSMADSGVWVTARPALADCPRPAVLINDTDGVAATIAPGPAGPAAVLTTHAGAPALALAAPPRPGALAFAAGFPRGRPGEVALRLLGRTRLPGRGRGAARTPALAWAEIGRTQGLGGALDGMTGAPALDAEGRVVGLVLREAPRRGLLFTTTPEAIAAALDAAGARRPPVADGVVLTVDNYGLAADDLRRSLRVVALACLRR